MASGEEFSFTEGSNRRGHEDIDRIFDGDNEIKLPPNGSDIDGFMWDKGVRWRGIVYTEGACEEVNVI
jgi:hypothetical protein